MIFKNILDKWSLYLTILVNISGLVLVRFGLLNDGVYLPFLLFTVTVFFMHQLSYNSKLEKKISDMSVMNERARKVTTAEFYRLFKSYVSDATVSIDLTIHLNDNPEISGHPEISAYFKEIDRVIKRNKVRVRRITTISSPEKLELVKHWCDKYSKSDLFYMKYSPIEDGHLPPPLSVMIIDKKITLIVGLSTGFHDLSGEDMDLIIEGEESSFAFLAYYEAYWSSLKFIKDGRKINRELLTDLEELYNKSIQTGANASAD